MPSPKSSSNMVDVHVHNEGTVFNGGQRVVRKKGNQSKWNATNPNALLQQKNANVCASSLINCKLRCDLEPLDIPPTPSPNVTAVSASPKYIIYLSEEKNQFWLFLEMCSFFLGNLEAIKIYTTQQAKHCR